MGPWTRVRLLWLRERHSFVSNFKTLVGVSVFLGVIFGLSACTPSKDAGLLTAEDEAFLKGQRLLGVGGDTGDDNGGDGDGDDGGDDNGGDGDGDDGGDDNGGDGDGDDGGDDNGGDGDGDDGGDDNGGDGDGDDGGDDNGGDGDGDDDGDDNGGDGDGDDGHDDDVTVMRDCYGNAFEDIEHTLLVEENNAKMLIVKRQGDNGTIVRNDGGVFEQIRDNGRVRISAAGLEDGEYTIILAVLGTPGADPDNMDDDKVRGRLGDIKESRRHFRVESGRVIPIRTLKILWNINDDKIDDLTSEQLAYLGDTIDDPSDFEKCDDIHSPLMVPIGRSATRIELSRQDLGVMFDIDADGDKEQLSWPVRPEDVAILAMDRNGNGRIEDGSELFGNHSVYNGVRSDNGFDNLANYDSAKEGGNEDGLITEADRVYDEIKAWVDGNRNGVAEKSELLGLRDVGIRAIHLRYVNMNEEDRYGNRTMQRSLVHFLDAQGNSFRRAIVDIWLMVRGR